MVYFLWTNIYTNYRYHLLIEILYIFIVTPFDVVKIRLQAQNNPFPKGMCSAYPENVMLGF